MNILFYIKLLLTVLAIVALMTIGKVYNGTPLAWAYSSAVFFMLAIVEGLYSFVGLLLHKDSSLDWLLYGKPTPGIIQIGASMLYSAAGFVFLPPII